MITEPNDQEDLSTEGLVEEEQESNPLADYIARNKADDDANHH